MDVPDDLLPDESKPTGKQPIQAAEKLNRLSACLRKKLRPDDYEQIDTAVSILKAINVMRNKVTHDGVELVDAFLALGIEYPIYDYARAWDQLRSKAAEALTIIRSLLEAVV